MYAGCVSGAIQLEAYLDIIKKQGFKSIDIQKKKEVPLPDEILKSYLSDETIQEYKNSGSGIFSITVSAIK
jgi:arsenite methyltransferase